MEADDCVGLILFTWTSSARSETLSPAVSTCPELSAAVDVMSAGMLSALIRRMIGALHIDFPHVFHQTSEP